MHALHAAVGEWSGDNSFRLKPDDEFTTAPSTARATAEVDGWGWSLRYTWVHPTDGPQSGLLLVGSPGDDGVIRAVLLDSWHQNPDFGVLTGSVTDSGVHIEMEYAPGWRWQIDLRPEGDTLRMLMHNVLPDDLEGAEPGPYLVMDATWQRRS